MIKKSNNFIKNNVICCHNFVTSLLMWKRFKKKENIEHIIIIYVHVSSTR